MQIIEIQHIKIYENYYTQNTSRNHIDVTEQQNKAAVLNHLVIRGKIIFDFSFLPQINEYVFFEWISFSSEENCKLSLSCEYTSLRSFITQLFTEQIAPLFLYSWAPTETTKLKQGPITDKLLVYHPTAL